MPVGRRGPVLPARPGRRDRGAGRAVPAAGRPGPAGPVRRGLPAGPGAPAGHRAARPAGPLGADYYPCERVTELPEGRLEVTLRAADPTWVRRLVLGLGRAEVVGPAWFAEQVRVEAAEALAAYGVGPGG